MIVSTYSGLRPHVDLSLVLSFGTGARGDIICILITLPLAQIGAVRKCE